MPSPKTNFEVGSVHPDQMLCCARDQVPEYIVVVNPDDGGLMFAIRPKPSPPALDVVVLLCVHEGMDYMGTVHILADHVGEHQDSWKTFLEFCVDCFTITDI
jgi:hypothetical protein